MALELIEKADYLIFPCGSLHGSILVNFLPIGVQTALKKSKAKKVLVANLVSSRNETHNFKLENYLEIFQKYSDLTRPLDTILVPKLTRLDFEKEYPEIATRYASEHSYFLGWQTDKINDVEVIKHDATIVDPVLKRLRHNPQKLAEIFQKIIS